MDNNEADLKGVLAIKPQSVPGFWMALPIADINCLEELGSLLKIQPVNEISFWTMQSFSISKRSHCPANRNSPGSKVIPKQGRVHPRIHMQLL